jgi:hypothetical protein
MKQDRTKIDTRLGAPFRFCRARCPVLHGARARWWQGHVTSSLCSRCWSSSSCARRRPVVGAFRLDAALSHVSRQPPTPIAANPSQSFAEACQRRWRPHHLPASSYRHRPERESDQGAWWTSLFLEVTQHTELKYNVQVHEPTGNWQGKNMHDLLLSPTVTFFLVSLCRNRHAFFYLCLRDLELFMPQQISLRLIKLNIETYLLDILNSN